MKEILSKRFVLPVLLVILYLLGLIVGAFAISIYPINRQKAYFLTQARAIAQEYIAGEDATLQSMIGANMHILVYDGDGNCLRHITSNKTKPSAAPVVSLDKDLSRVLNGETLFHAAAAQVKSRTYNRIMVVTGVPITNGVSIIGAVFLVKNLMDLPEAIIGYVCYFTLFYWLSAFFIVSNIRKKKKLDRLQQTYIANVTHALKSPIAAVKTLTETLCDVESIDTNTQRTYYGLILQEMNQQSHMVHEILELSKLQSRERDFAKDFIDAHEIFTPILEKYAMLCDCAHISLRVSDTIFELPPLYTNASCVKQVLEILLENALKYAEVGCMINVEASVAKNQVLFCVRDNGIGIAAEDLPYVFDRFYKCNRNKSGSGLGLAIAKEIIVGLKERIWVESELEKGATFFFSVRLK